MVTGPYDIKMFPVDGIHTKEFEKVGKNIVSLMVGLFSAFRQNVFSIITKPQIQSSQNLLPGNCALANMVFLFYNGGITAADVNLLAVIGLPPHCC